ncbi:MAG: hypothetical protein IKO49_00270 [Bacilli bacterium]|nr:hypothetical protein [Bacilli bacterium]
MINIYKKTEKSLNNTSGIIEIQNINELERPFLLCISAQENYDKSIYGIIRQGAQAARVYTTQEKAAGFKIDQFPIDFLGFRFIKDNNYNNSSEEIVDRFILPFLIRNNNISDIKKQATKMNFMTYCNGTTTYELIEKRLEEKLKGMSFQEEDINDVISNMSLISIGSMTDTSNLKSQNINFIDVNDTEISTEETLEYKKILTENNRKSIYGTLNNSILYIYEGNGIHDLKEYFKDENIVKPAICSITSLYITQSLQNEKTKNIIKSNKEEIFNILKTYSDETKKPSDLLNKLDINLNYENSPKYTKEEAKLKYEFDISCRALEEAKNQLEREKRNSRLKEEQINSIIDSIKQYSSDTAFYQILVSSGMWQEPPNRNIFEEKSDKEIRDEYNQQKGIKL